MQDDAVIVIGGGLVGLSTAYELSSAGRQVVLLERRGDVGLETSFANAGMLTPSMSEPWNHPGIVWELLQGMLGRRSSVIIRPETAWRYIDWGLHFVRGTARSRFQRATQSNYALSRYSVLRIQELRKQLELQYHSREAGTLKVFRDQATFTAAVDEAGFLATLGLDYQVLGATELSQHEPILADCGPNLVGGIAYPNDETGHSHAYCQGLAGVLRDNGVDIRTGTAVDSILREAGQVTGIATSAGNLPARCVVVAAGAWSPQLLGRVGRKLPIRPVKGYSVTAPIRRQDLLPRGAIIDQAMHAAITPLGDSLRMAGIAELAGWNRQIQPARVAKLWRMAEGLSAPMAAALDSTQATEWCGLRPISASGVPTIGATPVAGLFVNAGHGYLGFTQSAGSARLLTQLILGQSPEIDPRPYAWAASSS